MVTIISSQGVSFPLLDPPPQKGKSVKFPVASADSLVDVSSCFSVKFVVALRTLASEMVVTGLLLMPASCTGILMIHNQSVTFV
jgi:hypothetical protein